MNDALLDHCRSLPGTTEDVKWGDNLMFSVGGKIYAGFQLPDNEPVAFKVDPAVFDEMAERRGFVPAPYAARYHWVSVPDRKKVAASTLKKLLAESHRLVAEKLPKSKRQSLGL